MSDVAGGLKLRIWLTIVWTSVTSVFLGVTSTRTERLMLLTSKLLLTEDLVNNCLDVSNISLSVLVDVTPRKWGGRRRSSSGQIRGMWCKCGVRYDCRRRHLSSSCTN